MGKNRTLLLTVLIYGLMERRIGDLKLDLSVSGKMFLDGRIWGILCFVCQIPVQVGPSLGSSLIH